MSANNITMQGKPLTLIGRKIKVGETLPKFTVTNDKLEAVSLDNFADKIKILTSFISLDTPVCDSQVKQFNQKATKLSSNVIILGISKDLPFAQARFCSMNNIKNINVYSDYKNSSFGINLGLLIKELNLLARSTIIADSNNVIRYIQICNEITNAPDYDDVLKNLQDVINSPALPKTTEETGKCVPCEEGTPPLPKEKVAELLLQVPGWELVEDKKIVKEFKFKDFVEAKYFLDLLAVIAEEQGHHPNFSLMYYKLKVTLTTHVAGGLTDNDFIMAKIINSVGFDS